MACRKYPSNQYCNLLSSLTLILTCLFCAVFIYEFIIVPEDYPMKIPILVVFIIISFLIFASYFATSCIEPGKVPFYYGLTPENIQTPVRKYCVICHNFKPERSHHCSTCQKCVMNMDHHCPWVNNCIGFHNRKFFLQFVGYLALGLILISIVGTIFLIGDFKRVFSTNETDIHFALRLILVLASIPLAIILGSFFFFHLSMILQNTTTLEGMIKKRKEEKIKNMRQGNESSRGEQMPDYDIGKMQNFQQVFGENGFYWFVPLFGDGPKGNGIYWPKDNDSDLMATGRGNHRNMNENTTWKY